MFRHCRFRAAARSTIPVTSLWVQVRAPIRKYVQMTVRNNRQAYHQPTPAEVALIKRDPCNVQWRDVLRVASKAAHKNLTAWEGHDCLGIKPTIDNVQMHGKPVWGWW